MNNKNYTIFHRHDSSSHLDGLKNPEHHVAIAKKLGMTSFGVSNHGNLFSCLDHWQECRKQGIKPILGNELYIPYKPAYIKDNTNRSLIHMVVWAKNLAGWKTLMQLTTHTNKPEYYYYKPRIFLWNTQDANDDMHYGLEHFANGNIQGFSGHLGSHLSMCPFIDIENDDMETIKASLGQAFNHGLNDPEHSRKFLRDNWLETTCNFALKLEKLFGKGNFWIELQDAYNPKDKMPVSACPIIVECLREVSKNTGIPAVASSDPHYPSKEDADLQRLLLAVRLKQTEQEIKQKLDSDSENDLLGFFGSDEFCIRSYDEMREKFTEEELEETNRIAAQIEEYNILHQPILPNIDVPVVTNALEVKGIKTNEDKYLLHLCIQGARDKCPWKDGTIDKGEYWARIKEELETICEFNLSRYFLIVRDIIQWGKNNGMMFGPARGSVSGSLVAYLCGITAVDSLKHKLFFSRFLNKGRLSPERVQYPDIDIDIDANKRDQLIEHIKNKYGQENVAKISTTNNIKGRNAIKDVFRYYGFNFDVANDVSQHIPDESLVIDQLEEERSAGDETYGLIDWTLEHSEEFKGHYEKYKKYIDLAKEIENSPRNKGVHAAGIVIMPGKISDYFPMMLDTHGKELIIAEDYRNVEKMGGVKLDLLGLSTLSKLQTFKDSLGDKAFDLFSIDFSDPRTLALFQRGDTKGTFQTEANATSNVCRQVQPNNLRELCDTIALSRPGASETGACTSYINRKHGKEKCEPFHPALEHIMRDTYQCLIYQEQIIAIAIAVGMSEVEADEIRYNVSKKLPKGLAESKEKFIQTAKRTGVLTEEEATNIFEGIERSSRYLFSINHSWSYSVLSFITGYAKTHYPLHFYYAWLKHSDSKPDQREEVYELIKDMKLLTDIVVLPPCLSRCNEDFEIVGKKEIAFGIKHIKGIGEKASKSILKHTKGVKTFNEFVPKIKSIKRNVAESLIKSGACDYFGLDRTVMIKYLYAIYGSPNPSCSIVKGLTDKEMGFFVEDLAKTGCVKASLGNIISNKICVSNRVNVINAKIDYLNTPQKDTNTQKAIFEKIYLGLNITCSSVDDVDMDDKHALDCKEVYKTPTNEIVNFYCAVDEIKKTKTKKEKKDYCFLKVSDNSGSLDNVVMWPDTYSSYHESIYEGMIAKIKAKKKSFSYREFITVENLEIVN